MVQRGVFGCNTSGLTVGDRRLWKRSQGEESVSQQVWALFVLKVSRSPLAARDAKSKKYDSGAGDLRPPHCRTPVYTKGCWRAHVELMDLLHLCCCYTFLWCDSRDQEISDLQSTLAVLIIKSLILMPVLMQCDIYIYIYTHILEPSNVPIMEIGLITSCEESIYCNRSTG